MRGSGALTAAAVTSPAAGSRSKRADRAQTGSFATGLPDRVPMHHHRLVLNGPPAAVGRLAGDLRAAGAVDVSLGDGPPARLVWATSRPSAVEALCARHRAVVVGIERFEALGERLERLILHGREATLLEHRTVATGPEAADLAFAGEDGDGGAGDLLLRTDHETDALAGWGLCLDEGGEALDVSALRTAARRVAARPVDVGPGAASSALFDALLLGPAIGRLCAAAGDPLADDLPPAAALDAIAALAAVALTVAAASAGSAAPAELAFERAWRLTQAMAHASRETLWARPGDADWPEWLMHLLAQSAAVVERCAECLHQPAPAFVSIHTEHLGTVEEDLDRSACGLVSIALQALVLFGV